MLSFIIDDKIFLVSGRLGLTREPDCSVESDVGKIIFDEEDHKPAVARKSVIVPTFRNEREFEEKKLQTRRFRQFKT